MKNDESAFHVGEPIPGGEVLRWHLFDVKVDQQTGMETGVKTPEGNYYGFFRGEIMSFDQSSKGDDREPMIVRSDGSKIPFEQWVDEQDAKLNIRPNNEQDPNKNPERELSSINPLMTEGNVRLEKIESSPDSGSPVGTVLDGVIKNMPVKIGHSIKLSSGNTSTVNSIIPEPDTGNFIIVTEGGKYRLEPSVLIDKARVNAVVAKTGEGIYFGKHITLEQRDREAIAEVVGLSEKILEIAKASSKWKKFEELTDRLFKEGAILSLIFPPNWLIDAGPNAEIQEVRENLSVKVHVPSDIYNLYCYNGIAQSVRNFTINMSNESIRGRSTSGLGDDLRKLAYLLKQNNCV